MLCSVQLADSPSDSGGGGGYVAPVTATDPAPATTSTSSTPGVAAGGGAINIGLRIAAAGIGIAWGPARPVHEGAVVEVYPIPANTQSVFVGTDGDPNCFQSSSRNVEVPKGAPMMVFPIENLGSLIVKNTVAGEGIVVRIRTR
jgi:hypothetical protein